MAKEALLLSIRPRFAELIFTGLKTVELRRMRPRIGKDDVAFVYVSSPVKALAGAFEVEEVVSDSPRSVWRQFGSMTGITKAEFTSYYAGRKIAYAIRIRRYWRLNAPIRLDKLRKDRHGFHPPQGYQYVSPQRFGRPGGFEGLLARTRSN